jgi:hypothetical protein
MTIEEALKEIRDEASYDSYSHPSQWALDKLDRIWELANEALKTAVARVDQLEKGLAILYRSHPVDVARVCDDVIDQRGALLGRVRDLAGVLAEPATEEKPEGAGEHWPFASRDPMGRFEDD